MKRMYRVVRSAVVERPGSATAGELSQQSENLSTRVQQFLANIRKSA